MCDFASAPVTKQARDEQDLVNSGLSIRLTRSLRRRKPQPLSLEVAKTFGRFAVDRKGGQWERRFVRTIRIRF